MSLSDASCLKKLSKKISEVFAEHKAVKALKSYLGGSVQALDNWKPSEDGTEFRCQVWKEIAKGKAADNLNSSPRAVGSACGDNPLPIFVGCHRVVGKSNLGGFAHSADNLSIKCWLLKHEQQNM